MTSALGEAFVPIRATLDKLDKDLADAKSKIQGALGGVGDNLAKAGTLALSGLAVVAAGAATAILAIGAAAFMAGGQVDEAFDTILVKTGATGAEAAELQDVFRDVFQTIPTEAGPAAEAIATLNQRLGLTGDELGDVAKPLLEMTRLLGGDAAQNTELFTRVMGDWGVASEDAAGVLDRLFVAQQQTGIGVEDLMMKVVQFGSPLRLMGFSLEDSIAIFAKWEAEGVNAELVMGSLRIAAGKFAKDGVPLRESLLATFESIKNNTDASGALAEAMEVFGARAGPDMAAAIREGRFEFEDLMGAMEGADGAILSTASATADWAEKLTLLKNKATIALEPLGTVLFGLAGTVLDKLTPAFEAALPVITDFGAAIGAFLEVLFEGDIGGAFDALGEFESFQAIFQGLGIDVYALGGFVEDLFDTFRGLVDIFILGKEPLGDWSVLWEKLSGVVGPELATTLLDIIATVKQVVDTAIGWVGENIKLQDVLIALGVAIAAVVVPAIISVVAAAAPIVATFIAVIAVAALLRTAWEENWGGIQEKTAAVWAAVQPLLAQAQEWLQTNIPLALEALRAWWVDTVWPAILRVVEVVWPIIQGIFQAVVSFITDVYIPTAARLMDFWVNTVWPAILRAVEIVWPIIEGIFIAVRDWIVNTLIPTVADLYTQWTTVWWPQIETALTNAWTVIETVFKEIDRWVNDNIIPWVEELQRIWAEVVWPAIQKGVEDFWAVVGPIWEDLQLWLATNIPVAVEALTPIFEGAMTAISAAVQPVKDLWDRFVTAITDFWNWITSHTFSFSISIPDLPDWAVPGSPLPIHTAWKDFAGDLSRMTITPHFDLDSLMPVAALVQDGGADRSVRLDSTTNVYTSQDPMRVLRASRHLDKLGALA